MRDNEVWYSKVTKELYNLLLSSQINYLNKQQNPAISFNYLALNLCHYNQDYEKKHLIHHVIYRFFMLFFANHKIHSSQS